MLNIMHGRAQYRARPCFLLSTPVLLSTPRQFLPDSPAVSPCFSGGFSQRDGTSYDNASAAGFGAVRKDERKDEYCSFTSFCCTA